MLFDENITKENIDRLKSKQLGNLKAKLMLLQDSELNSYQQKLVSDCLYWFGIIQKNVLPFKFFE